MKQINGATIIAHRDYSNIPGEGYVILCVKPLGENGYEYITSVVKTLDDREWNWGHYFYNALEAATKDFNER